MPVPPSRSPSRKGYELAEPGASALIESLRAFGYTIPAAVADLVDNSITAGATNIHADFGWDGGNSHVSIRDDGRGMTEDQLHQAMRPASRNPKDLRDVKDLGRFGLGLKTASFSQCRRLSVQSRTRGGVAATRCWDLDYVGETDQWRLLKKVGKETDERLGDFEGSRPGTVVLWEKLDRIVPEGIDAADRKEHSRFLEIVEEVKKHLGMVFHRFLAGKRPLKIFVNGMTESHRVLPWDPFLEGIVATQELPVERLQFRGAEISVRPFVLPHHDKIDSATHRDAAGVSGWNEQQGFYVYRNQRLLVPGSWLGLGFAKEEHHKLARIQLDITNALDGDWDIDVKKSRARPPGPLRDDLRRIARLTRKQAEEVYRHRGQYEARKVSEPHVFAWHAVKKDGKTHYLVNRDHPLVKRVLEAPPELRPAVRSLLRLLEESVPVQQIWIDAAEEPECQRQPFQDTPAEDILEVIREVYDTLRRSGLSHALTLSRLKSMKDFTAFLHLVTALDTPG